MNSSEYRYFEVVGEDTGKILDDSLDARLVEYTKDPDDGYEKSHLKGHTVIAQLNRIFGYAGHSWEVTSKPILIGGEGVDRQTGEILSPIGYTCTGRLTVKTKSGPVSFDGVGVERLDGVSFNSHDKALKGAETDAMKRAARHLGTQFGLSLYFDGAFDVPAHFRVDSGESPAKAEAPAARQPGGRDQSQSRGGDQSQSRRPAQSQQRGNGGQKPQQNGGQKPQQNGGQKPQQNGGQKPQQNGGQKPQQNGGQKPRQNGGQKPRQNGEPKPLGPMPKLDKLARAEAEGLLIEYAQRQSDKVTEEIVRQQVLDHTGRPLAELEDAELHKMIASSYRKLRAS